MNTDATGKEYIPKIFRLGESLSNLKFRFLVIKIKMYERNFDANVHVANINGVFCKYETSTSNNKDRVIPIIASGKAKIRNKNIVYRIRFDHFILYSKETRKQNKTAPKIIKDDLERNKFVLKN